MRKLPFRDDSFHCVYSYNSIFHMKKKEIQQSISEMFRVLKPGGLLFYNLLSTDDQFCGEGIDLGTHEYMDEEDHVIHSYHTDEEAANTLPGGKTLIREKRYLTRTVRGRTIHQVFIDYILEK